MCFGPTDKHFDLHRTAEKVNNNINLQSKQFSTVQYKFYDVFIYFSELFKNEIKKIRLSLNMKHFFS